MSSSSTSLLPDARQLPARACLISRILPGTHHSFLQQQQQQQQQHNYFADNKFVALDNQTGVICINARYWAPLAVPASVAAAWVCS
jgi:hypothetical protein